MENPQSLEEVLHELEWLIKSESDTKPSNSVDENSNQNEDLNFDNSSYDQAINEKDTIDPNL